MKNNSNKIIDNPKFFLIWGIYILSFIFFNILISSILLIIKIPINIIIPFISIALSGILNYFILKKEKINSIKHKILSYLIPLLLIISSICISTAIYDYSYDGNTYHKTTIGMLMDGWNPVYEKMEDFNKKLDEPLIVNDKNMFLWCNHYAKASHFFASSIGKITGNVESGKCINFLSMAMLFLFALSTIINKKKDLLFCILTSLCFVTMSSIINQLFTNYVDGLVYIFFFIIIFFFLIIEKDQIIKNKNIYLLIYSMSLIIAINIKFSLFAYVGIFCLGYYLWYIIRLINKKIDKKYFIKFTIISAVSVSIAVFTIGLSVYPKNFLNNGHPFYPLMGKNKVDIMTHNEPKNFHNKKALEKFMVATFSRVDNIQENTERNPILKIPFSIYKNEIKYSPVTDTRISGNGILFSGILLLSLVLLIINLIKLFKKDKTLFFFMIIPLCITFIMIIFYEEAWWARYFPQLHLIILFTIILLIYNNSKKAKIIVFILLANNFLNVGGAFSHSIQTTIDDNKQFKEFEKSHTPNDCNLVLYTDYFTGSLYNVKNKLARYNYEYSNIIVITENQINNNYFMNNTVIWRCKK